MSVSWSSRSLTVLETVISSSGYRSTFLEWTTIDQVSSLQGSITIFGSEERVFISSLIFYKDCLELLLSWLR
ncbi:hypothetical protein GOP47_0011197 [Adiantum capillus-veneris]|uniref:Uncharacterized protein n=1 Tax=Adiantum capillus-veneris TaxID=13818 RepID=A0A9D4USR4_ADICA|nr:hypothetical protein GOP47_0011197 [Adiantum capillus-veneris]